jgi:hypothetical protein
VVVVLILLLLVVVIVMTVMTELDVVVDAVGADRVMVVLEITTMLKLDVEADDWGVPLGEVRLDCPDDEVDELPREPE